LLEKNITGITFEHDVYYHHSQNLIKNNIFRNNELGMSMIMSDHNVIRNNTYENNSGHAIEISTCEGGGVYNLFYQNNFIDNNSTHKSDTMQVLNGCWARNLWHNNGNGNYWSDYKGSDKDGNGIGDEIYLISSFGDFFLADSFPTINNNTGIEIDRSEYYQEKNKILISPNPASDYIEITVPAVILSEAKSRNGVETSVAHPVLIFDILGMEITTPNLTPTLSKGEGAMRLDVSSLSPGIYFVRIGDVVKKFVKY
jgi:parallel beta-helix repeat protein